MKNLKQEIDDLVRKKVITAYFDNSEDRHGFLYLRIETVANFAELQFKEDDGVFFYAPTDTKENWKPVTLDSLETLILDRIMYKGTYFTCKDKVLIPK